MKTWLFFMTLFLAPFWAFGKEKAKDQVETDEGKWEVPEHQLPICYFLGEVDPSTQVVHNSCGVLHVTALPFDHQGPFYLPGESQKKGNLIDDELIKELNRLGILNKAGVEGGDLCGTRH